MKKLERFFSGERHPARSFWLRYTVLFSFLALLCFGYFWINGKSLVWEVDGFSQHYKALIYYAQWMRQVLRTLLVDHSLSLPTFSLSFGLGADAFTTLQYYVIGDPFNLLAVLVPTRYMASYYGFMILLRLYFAGLAFSAYARYLGKEETGVLAGSFVYVFCSFSLRAAVRHPYFANPMIFFPLLLLGVEKLRRERKPWTMVFSVAIAAASNFYFFYMLVVLVVCYVLLETLVPWGKGTWKRKLGTVLRIAGASVLGVLLSAVLLPVLLLFLSDTRSGISRPLDLFYPVPYYKELLQSFISIDSPGYWAHPGVSAAALPALFLLFRRKGAGRLRLKIAAVIVFLSLLLPIAGRAMNGFAYVSNRWTWAVAFLMAFLLAELWPDLFSLSRKELACLGICYGAYVALAFLACPELSVSFCFSACLGALGLFALCLASHGERGEKPSRGGKRAQAAYLALAAAGVCGLAFFQYSVCQGNYVQEFMEAQWLEEDLSTHEGRIVEAEADPEEFSRYSGYMVANTSLLTGLSNTRHYWSLTNGSLTDLYNETLTETRTLQSLSGFDARTALEELCSVKYYVALSEDREKVPYGYELLKEASLEKPNGSSLDCCLFENKYALPFGATYPDAVSAGELEGLSPLALQEAMLQAVAVDGPGTKSAGELSYSQQEVGYELQYSSRDISLQGDAFVATAPGQSVTLRFSGIPSSETYLSIENLDFAGFSEYGLYTGGKECDPLDLYREEDLERKTVMERRMLKKEDRGFTAEDKLGVAVAVAREDGSGFASTFVYESPRYQFYNGRRDHLLNLGYSDSPVVSVTITFPARGRYSFDGLKLICQPMDSYPGQVSRLTEDVLEDLELHENSVFATNRITGSISLEREKYLFLSIPWSAGWKAFVDGKEVEILKANCAFMALRLDPGQHEIELRYHTPGLKPGLCLSAVGIVLAAALALWRRFKRKKA